MSRFLWSSGKGTFRGDLFLWNMCCYDRVYSTCHVHFHFIGNLVTGSIFSAYYTNIYCFFCSFLFTKYLWGTCCMPNSVPGICPEMSTSVLPVFSRRPPAVLPSAARSQAWTSAAPMILWWGCAGVRAGLSVIYHLAQNDLSRNCLHAFFVTDVKHS